MPAKPAKVGRQAVRLSADNNHMELSVVMKRTSGSPYKIELEHTSIKNVAKDTKHLAAEYIRGGNDITQAFIDYAKPLVGQSPVVGTFPQMRK